MWQPLATVRETSKSLILSLSFLVLLLSFLNISYFLGRGLLDIVGDGFSSLCLDHCEWKRAFDRIGGARFAPSHHSFRLFVEWRFYALNYDALLREGRKGKTRGWFSNFAFRFSWTHPWAVQPPPSTFPFPNSLSDSLSLSLVLLAWMSSWRKEKKVENREEKYVCSIVAMVASLAIVPIVQAGIVCVCGGSSPGSYCGRCSGDDAASGVCKTRRFENECNE